MAFINFSKNAQKKEHIADAWVLLTLASLFSIAVGFPFGFALLVLSLIVLFSVYMEWGLYVMLGIVFMHGFEVIPSNLPGFEQIVFLQGINAPLVNFFSFFLLASFLLACVWRLYYNLSFSHIYRLFPGGIWYALFLGVSFLSAQQAYENMVSESTGYVLYPMLFVYAAYIVLLLALIQSQKVLQRTLLVLFFVGIGIASFGLLGFFQSIGQLPWPRVTPLSFFGIAPFGYNHNLLAETLVTIIPIGWFGYVSAKKVWERQLFFVGTLFMTSITLLTLSRAAWLVLLFDIVILAYLFRDHAKKYLGVFFSKLSIPFLLVTVLAIGYMGIFLGSSVVSSSNDARIYMTEAAFFYTMRHPILGLGPNMFIPVLQDTIDFTQQFGDPLDAHGIIQKVLFETGILGFICIVGFLWYVLVSVYKEAKQKQNYQLLALWFVAFSAIVFQLFNTSYFNANMWFPIGLALAGLQLSKYGDEYVNR